MSWNYPTKTGLHAWSNPDQPLPDDVDWANKDFLNQFIGAYNERRILFFINDDPFFGHLGEAFYVPEYPGPGTYGGWTPIPSGFDVQAASFYFVDESLAGDPGAFIWGAGSLQGGIQAIVGNKGEDTLTNINYHAFLNATTIPTFDGASPATCEAQWWTIASFNAAMGFPPGNTFINFRRKRNMQDAFSYGPHQAGDIIGPWIFEDLRRAYAKLTVCFVGLSDRYNAPLGIGPVSRRITAEPGYYVSPPTPPGIPSYAERRTITPYDHLPSGGYRVVAFVDQDGPYGSADEDQEQIRMVLLLGTQHPHVVGKGIEFDLYLYAEATSADINFQVPELVESRLSARLFGGRQTATLGGSAWISPAWIGSDELLTEAEVFNIHSGASGSSKFSANGTMVVRMTNPDYP